MTYDFRSDVAPFVGLLALGSISGNALEPGEGDRLSELWQDALENWYEGDRTTTFSTLDTLLSELERQGLSRAAVAGQVRHQYGMQLKAKGETPESLSFLQTAVATYQDWLDSYSPQFATNLVLGHFGNFLYAITEILMAQLAHEFITGGRYFAAFDFCSRGLEYAHLTNSSAGELVHTVNRARVRHQLEETELAKSDYEEAFQSVKTAKPASVHDQERIAFACWQLGKLDSLIAGGKRAEQLFSIAKRTSASWIHLDLSPYFREFEADIKQYK